MLTGHCTRPFPSVHSSTLPARPAAPAKPNYGSCKLPQGRCSQHFILFFDTLLVIAEERVDDAITFASRVKREALVGARSSPFLAQAVSTAGSPIALAGRASCAAAVAFGHNKRTRS